jgi:transcriptional regulator with XRE-family HTH domain
MSRDPIAQGLAKLISERGIMQKFVAEKSGFTKQQMSDMLNGRKTIKAVDIPPLARAIGVTVQDIYDAGSYFIPQKGA